MLAPRGCARRQQVLTGTPFLAKVVRSASTSALPRAAVALAVFLLTAGVSLFVAGLALWGKHNGSSTPLLLSGALLILPGGYHTHIAWKASRGVRGYSFDDIPSM